ncbi:MAG: hypothetical protein AAF226_10975 [Verrucomicrobiota bacterium]
MKKVRWCWRKDLTEFRGLSESDKNGFLLVLEWFENFRLRNDLEASRDSAKLFWRTEVNRDGTEREHWQLEQWESAIRWYLDWLHACEQAKTISTLKPVEWFGFWALGLRFAFQKSNGANRPNYFVMRSLRCPHRA